MKCEFAGRLAPFKNEHKILRIKAASEIVTGSSPVNLGKETNQRMDEVIMFWPEGRIPPTQERCNLIATLDGLREAMTKKIILEARAARCDHQHNLWVDLPACKGVIPREEGALGIEDGTVRDIALISRVGRSVCFTVQELTTDSMGNRLAILSRRAAQKQCREQYLNRLRAGDVINTCITHLEPFGAFCDVGCGISSLIPIDAISVSRIFHPGDRFYAGQSVKAVVKGVDADGKIYLTHKELLGTWEENAALFRAGETVIGTVRTVESYGSFVELTPNLAGLAEPKEGVQAGQQAAVFIKSMIPEKMKVKLIIVDAFDATQTASKPPILFSGDHMELWRYSPLSCQKIIETRFS